MLPVFEQNKEGIPVAVFQCESMYEAQRLALSAALVDKLESLIATVDIERGQWERDDSVNDALTGASDLLAKLRPCLGITFTESTCGTTNLTLSELKHGNRIPEYTPKMTMKAICPQCGGENLSFDAYAEWDETNNRFLLQTTFNEHRAECADCECEINVQWKESNNG